MDAGQSADRGERSATCSSVPLVAAPAWTRPGTREERAPHRRGQRGRRAPAGRAVDGARVPDRRRAAPADRGGRDGARHRQGALRLRAHPPRGRDRPRHRRGARAAGPGHRRAPGAGDLRRARAAPARRWACWWRRRGPVDSVDEVDLPAPCRRWPRRSTRRAARPDRRQAAGHAGRVGEAGGRRHLGLLHAVPGRGRDAVRAVSAASLTAARAGLAGPAGADAADLRRRPARPASRRERDAVLAEARVEPGGGAAAGAGGGARQLRGDAARRPGAGVGARRRAPGAPGLRPGERSPTGPAPPRTSRCSTPPAAPATPTPPPPRPRTSRARPAWTCWSRAGGFRSRTRATGRRAEDRGADADDGRALGDRDLEIVGHAHRQLAQVDVRAGDARPRGRAARAAPRSGGGRRPRRRDQHQAGAARRASCAANRSSSAGRSAGATPLLAGLAGDVDLDQAGLRRAARLDRVEQRGANRPSGPARPGRRRTSPCCSGAGR